jgi:methyltransferase-like protein/2-polyprenyl-3-methyl-5-hydroxy-6-metoxy-1,4-benzoquinol methylase
VTTTQNDPVDQLGADYDATPYTSDAFPQSAPGHLAAIAHLFGLDAPDVSSARVLEIGCAAGGNIIPFAVTQPNARTVGIDLSPVQIDMGRQRVNALGIENLELVAGDIARMDLASLGEFDYIIAHGVYSWVPENVQEALLHAFRRLLAPEGVAYVSYNTYPGWKTKEVLRDAMLLASGDRTSPNEKALAARGMADFLGEVAPVGGVLARVVAESRVFSESFGDSYLLHDELETYNAPCYFYEMLQRARNHGLAFLGEAHVESMFPGNHGPKVAEYLKEKCSGVQVLIEQYLDFVANRMFRESLLVHAERAPQISYALDGSRYDRLHFAAFVPPVDGQTRMDGSRQEYEESDGSKLFTNDPGIKAALDALSERWPWTLSRRELIDDAQRRMEAAGLNPSSELVRNIDNLIQVLVLQGQARFRLDPVSPEPSSAPLRLLEPIRRMAEITREDSGASIFNLWHETLLLSPVDRHLLPLLDGTRDRDALLDALLAVDSTSPIPIEQDGESVTDDDARREALAAHVDALPAHLAELKLMRVTGTDQSKLLLGQETST